MICVIAGGGEARFPDTKDAFVIAADSGYNRCVENNIAPDLLVGDMDSIQGSVPDASDIPIVRAPCEKDDTDTMLAIKIGFERGYRDFVLTGVTGGKRLDHTLAAISSLEYIADHGGEGCIIDSSCKMFVQTDGTRRYEGRGAGYISVFSLTDSSRLAMRGLKYGGEDMTVTRDFPLGVSNNFREEYGEIQVYEGKILVIIEYCCLLYTSDAAAD